MRNVTISTGVRPGRIAVLTDINDQQWQSTCLRIIEYFTRTWGGCGNIIVPTDGKTISPNFWKLLEIFDADYLQAYRRTGADAEIEQPDKFEDQYQKHIGAWQAQIGGKTDPSAAKTIRENLCNVPLSKFDISPALQQELKRRLAPFFFQNWIVEARTITARSAPHHPHTDVLDILQNVVHPNRVFKAYPEDVFPPLWWAAAFGQVNGDTEARLVNNGIKVFELGRTRDDVKLLISLAVEGVETSPFLTDTTVPAIREMLDSMPSRLSMVGLSRYRSIKFHDWTEPVVAIAGSTVEDFALYYALSRIGTRVVWIPQSVTDAALAQKTLSPGIDAAWYFVNDLGNLARGNTQRYAGMKLVSIGLGAPQLHKLRALLSRDSIASFPCDIATVDDAIPDYPARYYEADNASVLRSLAIQDDGVIPLFQTPLPRNFAPVNPHKQRWLTELKVVQHHIPRHYVLGERLMGAPYFTSKDVRISSEGPTYFCPSNFLFGGATAESSVPRPSIRIPETPDIFEALAQSGGLVSGLSDKGFYAQSACDKFGGLEMLADFLRSQVGQLFVSAFLDRTEPKSGDHNRGVLLRDRRYLDFDSLNAVLGNELTTRATLDQLSQKGVLYRGYVLKCQFCRYADWLPLADLTDRFRCRRCHREQIFTSRHWRHPNQPNVYYQLDELFYLGLEHNMQVPVLALDVMRRASEESFLFVHEMAYTERDSRGSAREVDINCIVDGRISIGEAKKEGRLAPSEKEEKAVIGSYKSLADRLAAHQVIFATSEGEWQGATSDRIRKAFEDGHFKAVLLTRDDLYGKAIQ